jgi:outer membrane protein OmpA-like peptidoglycan-associated protein
LPATQNNDLLDLTSGALVLSATSQYGGRWNALALLDGTQTTGWSSTRGYPHPNTFVIELARQYVLTSFVVDNTGVEESSFPGISVRDFELYGSTTSHEEDFSLVLAGEAAEEERKVFALEKPTEARWLRLVVLSNWGNSLHAQIMELEAYGEPVGEVSVQEPVHGIYSTNYGLMRLQQSGRLVIGCYDDDHGTLSGRTDGRLFKFWWREDGPSAGSAFMVLSSDGNSLNGLWYEKSKVKGVWYGSRVTDDRRPKCKLPALGALAKSMPESGSIVSVQETGVERPLEQTGAAILYDIYFDSDSAEIKPESEARLQESLIVLQKSPSRKANINGHTDSTHTQAYNLELSLRRAQAVVGWLVKHGVDARRLQAKGYGESRSVADNNTLEGRALNRRVDIALQ